MKTNLKIRILALVLTLFMLVSVLPISAFASDAQSEGGANGSAPDGAGSEDSVFTPVIGENYLVGFPNTFRGVVTAEELEAALADGIDAICVSADFVIDRTFYITKNTIVYSEDPITLTRDTGFAGDVFVIGQDSENNLCEEQVTLSIGGFNGDTSGGLTINGNSENMTVDVVGTVFFVCPEAQCDLYDNLTITSCKKVGNDRAANEIYSLTNIANIGGSVAILSKSSFMNVYGGTYTDNTVNTTGESIYGGMFYNYATMNVYGGLFEGGAANRAGVFYNYRSLYIYSATIKNNSASTNGGAIYLPASSSAKLYLGGNNDLVTSGVLFYGNSAGSNGGAIFSSGRTSGQDTVFEGNSASNGGSVYVSGNYSALNLTDSSFIANTATGSGGAVYATGHNELDIENDVSLLGIGFEKNSAKSGGAIAIASTSCAQVKSCSFKENTATSYGGTVYASGATLGIDKAELVESSASAGGGIYMLEGTVATVNKLDAQGNTATGNGGTIYSIGSTLSLYNSTVKNGVAKGGSAIYLGSDATTTIYGSSFIGNSCLESNTANAGALYIYTGGTETTVHSSSFIQNTSAGLGGAMTISGVSTAYLYNITAIDNSAAKGGFLYETSAGTVVTASGITVSGNTASVGGPIIWGNTTNAKLYINKDNFVDLDVSGSLPDDYWSGAIVNSLKVYDSDAAIPPYTDHSGEIVDGLWSAAIVRDFDALKAALSSGAPYIKVVNDIEISETLYVTSSTVIFSTVPCTLTRADGFGGNLIVVGKDGDGVYTDASVVLTLGLSTSANADFLSIVGGEGESVIVVASGSQADIYENATVRGAIGADGSAISIETNATVNVYGGKIENNTSAANGVIFNNGTLNINGGSIIGNIADMGGAIYNIGTLNIHGGRIENNTARLGGAVYSLGILIADGGSITANTATECGGAVYVSEGSVELGCELLENSAVLGGAIYAAGGAASLANATFTANTATNGGAICIESDAALVDLIGAEFNKNNADLGGALYLSGADFDIKECDFTENTALCGGAIYVENANLSVTECTFNQNGATNGGAIYTSGAPVVLGGVNATRNSADENGGFIYAADTVISSAQNTFRENEADKGAAVYVYEGSLTTTSDTFESGYAFEGGAIYAECSDITVSGASFTANCADYNGGAVALDGSEAYISNTSKFTANSAANDGGAIHAVDSTLTSYGTYLNGNTSRQNGGAIAITDATVARIYTTVFTANSAKRNAGAVYASGDATVITLQLCDFGENSAANGGAVATVNGATSYIYSVKAERNDAGRGGFLYISGRGSCATVIGIAVSSNSAKNGQLVYGDNAEAVLNINKSSYSDAENPVFDAKYWEATLYGTLTINNVYDDVPEFIEEGNEPAGDLTDATDVSNADELEAALAAGRRKIRIIADFEIDRTFYITYNVTIFSTARHILTRSPDFGGDVFVVGEHGDGTNSMLAKADARLVLGNPSSDSPALLTVDGNKDNMTVDVTGSVIFICGGAIADIYENVSVINCYKVGNEKAYNEQYRLSRPNRVGGSVAIIAFGTLNVYGGSFNNNSIRPEDTSDEELRNSTLGGVFYNKGNLKIYGGVFEGNTGARGGVVYNYGVIKLYGGSFISNHATVSGGVYYSPSYSTTQLNIGYSSDTPILFKDNTAQSNGGAIYSTFLNGVVIYGNTTFDGNSAISGNGGAIYTSSTFTVKNTVFSSNTAKSRGGAVFVTRSSDNYVTRLVRFDSCSFIGNSASTGGALSIYSSDSDFESGAVVTTNACKFISNSSLGSGGAICTERKSTLTVNGTEFDSNSAAAEGAALYVIGESTVNINGSELLSGSAASHGGAISVRSSTLNISTTVIEGNYSDKNGGAIYIAYSSDIERNAKVTITDSTIKDNESDNGGAIYATRRAIENDTEVLTVRSTDFAGNVAKDSGGALLLTASVDVYMKDVTFVANSITKKTDGAGGAIHAGKSTLEIDGGVFTKNTSACVGGAISLGEGAGITLNNVTASRNSARTNGGFVYSTLGELTVYNSTVNNNTSNMGAGMYLYEGAVSSIYNTEFKSNKCTENGAALFIYTGGTRTVINGCDFESNSSSNFGGGLYISNKSDVQIHNATATGNSAVKGGFMYETTSGTVVELAALTVSGNTATGGSVIWGNTKNAVLNIDKTQYVDLDTETVLDDAYWQTAIEGALTVNDTPLTLSAAEVYTSYTEPTRNTVGKQSASVNDIFDLAINSSDGYINSTYDKFPVLDNSSNFMSRGTTVFENINGGTVTVDTFVYPKYSTAHNMTVGEALMIYQAMLYKQAYPDEEVYIDISSYRFSVQTAVNINRNSRYFGYTRALYTENYDEFGFVRVAYLLVSAAKMGIHVNVLGHREGYPIKDYGVVPSTFEGYFSAYYNDYCDPDYAPYGTISDYLSYCYFDWTLSEGGKGGTDMMHTKLCAVSHYIDMNGEIHKNAVWTSSSNLDGIKDAGYNANWKLQTATIVSDHEDIYRISVNYLRLMPKYGDQEGIVEFQNVMNVETTKQIDLILEGKYEEIPEDERLVYIGTENDDVFEMYFTPFGGDILSWSEIYNPYCKYMRELYNSEDYIIFTWNAAEYSGSFSLAQQLEQMLIDAFHKNKNPNNKIYVNMESFDPTTFDDLEVGVDIGFKSINQWPLGAIHNKDVQFSYVKDGVRYYVSLLNSLNLHAGSMYYQSNSALVIKETTCSENSVFSIVARYSTNAELVTHTLEDTERVEASETEHGYIYKVCSCCGHKEIYETLHSLGEWTVDRIATPEENGIRYRRCVVCDEIIVTEETKYNGSAINPESNTGISFVGGSPIPVYVDKAPLTIEATVLLDKSYSQRGGVIVGNYSSYEDENAINLEIYSQGRVRLFYITNGIRTDILFAEDIRSTEPVHLAVTVDGDFARLYVNGVLSETVEIHTPLPEIDKNMVVGADNRSVLPQVFKGKIYSVALFDRVRSYEEILTDKEYVSAAAPGVLYSSYFSSSDEPTYITGNTTGTQFKQNSLTELEVGESTVGTIEFTAMIPTSHEERAGVILGNYTDGTKDTLNLEIAAGGRLRLYYINGGVKHDYTFATDIRSDTPISIALVATDLEISLYVNGSLAETLTVEGALPTMSGAYAIGGDYRADNVQYFKGTLYSLNIFSTARSEAEIISDMTVVTDKSEGLIYSTYFTEKGNSSYNGQSFNSNVIGSTDCTIDKTPLTFEAIIQLSKDCNGRGGIIVSNNFKSNPIVSFEVYKEGKLRLYFVNGTTTVDCRFDTDVRSDKPIHVALTVDGTTAYLYINGVLTEVKELALPLPEASDNFYIGGDFRPGNTQYFKGTIYSVGLFESVRSAEQIMQDMLGTADGDGLMFYTEYINADENQVNDIHGNVHFEILAEPTADCDGLGKLICSDCGRVVRIYSIPYTPDTVNSNTHTDSALMGGEYFVVEGNLTDAPKTFEIELQLSPSITDRGGVILGNYDGTASGRMNLEIYTNGAPRLWYKKNGVSYSYIFNVDIRSEKSVHLTFTIDGTSASLYVNGIFAESVTLASEVPYDGSTFFIATDQRITAQSFKGKIYSVAMFADVRGAEEIAHDRIMVTGDSHALLFSKHFGASEGIQIKGYWADKNAIFVGDGITAGIGCEGDKYWQLLEQMLEFGSVSTVTSAEGTVSSTGTGSAECDSLTDIYDTVPEADLITIFMGTNDYGYDTPIGAITDTSDVSFLGALNVIIPALQAKYPNARIVFVTPLHRYGYGVNSATGETHTYDSIPNGAGHTLEDYVNAIIEACAKYGVDVIDLYNELELDPESEETREYYMEDGLHPNTAGHRLIAEFLEHALNALCEEGEQ